MRLTEKVAIITGAASGIGKETALLFAREGALIVVSDIYDTAGREVAELINQQGGKAAFIHCDVTSPEDAERLVKNAVEIFGGVDILINSAGIGLWGSVVEMEPENWDKVISVNLRGVYLVSKYAIPEIAKRGGGSVVNIGSGASVIGREGAAAYCASKAAVANLSRAMAVDHAKDKIRVNCVCPGVVDTAFNDEILTKVPNPEEKRKSQREDHLLDRVASPLEVAMANLFLASEESSFTTGSLLMVDGGMTTK
jgi:NAD(P)-dependent dehydrogenase (short-subunit alcohol dehydrogenase family)